LANSLSPDEFVGVQNITTVVLIFTVFDDTTVEHLCYSPPSREWDGDVVVRLPYPRSMWTAFWT